VTYNSETAGGGERQSLTIEEIEVDKRKLTGSIKGALEDALTLERNFNVA
jgi:hypothetical protein